MLVSLEAVCFWKTLCINLLPKRSSRLETSREREREMICILSKAISKSKRAEK